jgi:hypothetical protein
VNTSRIPLSRLFAIAIMSELFIVPKLHNQDEISALCREVSSWVSEAQVAGHPSNPGLETVPLGTMPACVQKLAELIYNQTDEISKQACEEMQRYVLIR